jgi:hypothetical protein
MNQLQEQVFDFIEQETLDAKRRFANRESVVDQVNIAAGYAFALYCDLTTPGRSLTFSQTMRDNRGVTPTDPEFFRHLHALEDFIQLVRPIAEPGTKGDGRD